MGNHEAEQPLTKLYLIRHGQSVGAIEPVVDGMKGDRGLTPLGVQQSEALRDRLQASSEITADLLISSPLPRAMQTAAIIAPALGLPVTVDDEVEELRPGIADGMTIEEADRLYPPVDFQREPFAEVDPGGESWAAFLFRVSHSLDRILNQHVGKTIVIVSHGGYLSGAFYHFFRFGIVGLSPVEFAFQNTSLTMLRQYLRHDQPRWLLSKHNDATHLSGLEQKLPSSLTPLPRRMRGFLWLGFCC